MGKTKARRGGKGKKAYLTHRKTFYDNHSPITLKTRNNGSINIAALVRDPITHRLIPVEYHATQTHGKRGLSIARASGPTVVAMHANGSTPSMIPRAQNMVRVQQLRDKDVTLPLKARVTYAHESWQAMRGAGLTEFHRIVLEDWKDEHQQTYYSVELFFSGRRWFFVQENLRTLKQSRSGEYKSKDGAYAAYHSGRIMWSETTDIPPPNPQPSG